jgi:p-cumate 2,3-dioxygenase beta subunit
MDTAVATSVTRSEIEDFLFHEAELLDAWKLDEWRDLLDGNASYHVPATDKPEASHEDTLFIIADDIVRLRERIIRLKDPSCHAEYPPSRTRRMITNVRLGPERDGCVPVKANFIVHRYRRNSDMRVFTGEYRYLLRITRTDMKIVERRAVLDAAELGALGSVSFIL